MFGRLGTLALSVLASTALAGVPALPTKVLFEGDSIVAPGTPSTWAQLWRADQPGVVSENYAVGGSQTSDLINRQAAALAYHPSHLIISIGANDLPDDTAGYLTTLYTYTDQFRAYGCKVYLVTVLPRTNRTDWSTTRANYRAAILAAVGTKIDGVIDLSASAASADGAENDTAIYPDGVHPSAAWHLDLKRTAAPTINHELGIPNEPLDFAFAPQNAATPDTDYDGPPYTVTGLYAGESRPLSVAGGSVRINGGSPVTSGTVVNGNTIIPINHSSANSATLTDVTVTIGTTEAVYSVTTAGAGSRDWLPSDLPDGVLSGWFTPDSIAAADEAEMNTWPDVSGDDVVLTGAGSSSKPIADYGANNVGGKAVRMVAAFQSKFTFPTNFLASQTSSSSICVMKLAADPPATGSWGPPMALFGSNTEGDYFLYNDFVYSSYCSTTRRQTGAIGPSLAAWRSVMFESAPSAWTFLIDGTAVLADASNTFGAGATPTIGYDPNAGYSSAHYAEFLHFRRKLTTTERQLVEGYLHWEHGLEANLPAGHPHKDARPTI